MNKYVIEALNLANYINDLEGFQFSDHISKTSCEHVGAVLVDTILQAGLNYSNIVLPRVRRLVAEFPNTNKLSDFKLVAEEIGYGTIMNWVHYEKISRLTALTEELYNCQIETHTDLYQFLQIEQNRTQLLELKGIGFKSVDYMNRLLGGDNVAVDRHIYGFVEMSGLRLKGYMKTKRTVEYAADILNVERSVLDHSIWNYMSNSKSNTTQLNLF